MEIKVTKKGESTRVFRNLDVGEMFICKQQLLIKIGPSTCYDFKQQKEFGMDYSTPVEFPRKVDIYWYE